MSEKTKQADLLGFIRSKDTDSLFEATQDIANSKARKFSSKVKGSGLDFHDFLQESLIALHKACLSYDYANYEEVPFRAYAHSRIDFHLRKYISANSRVVHIPDNVIRLIYGIDEVQKKRTIKMSIPQLAWWFGVSIDLIKTAMVSKMNSKSLNDLVSNDNDNQNELQDLIESHYPLPNEAIEEEDEHEYIREVIDDLNDEDRVIIKLRFGIEVSRVFTLEEIANHYECSSETIRLKEKRALRKLERKLKDLKGQ